MESDLVPYAAMREIPAKRVLVLAPHPDDEVFGCGGAIAAHLRQDAVVQVVILTEGDLHGDPSVRAKESMAAAALLGYGTPEFWLEKDRSLVADERLVVRLAEKLHSTQVDLIYAPSPWEIHPDHRQTCLLAVEALKRTESPCRIAFYEIGAPLRPNLLLDITPYRALKEQAMACFASQMQHQAYGEHMAALNRYRTYTLPADIKAAEAFLLMSADELPALADCLPAWAASPSPQALNRNPALVSILVRSTDRAYLLEALDSIALQTWPNIEVVVIAAKPEHKNLPQRVGRHPVRLIPTDRPLDRATAANRALKEARGEYLLFLDDDDWLMPSHIARLVHVLERQSSAHAAYTGIVLVKPDGTPAGQTLDLPFDWVRQRAGNLTPIHAVLFRSSLLSQGLAFDESLGIYEDWDFWLRLSQMTPLLHLPGISAAYRMHESSGVHDELMSANRAAKDIQTDWQTRPPVTQDEVMHRVWAFTDLETQLLGMHADLGALQVSVTERQSQLEHVTLQLTQKEEQWFEAQKQLENLHAQLASAETTVDAMRHSRSWRLTAPVRTLGQLARKVRNKVRTTLQRLHHNIQRMRRLPTMVSKFGWKYAWKRVRHQLNQGDAYHQWIENNEPAASTYLKLGRLIADWQKRPLVSVLMPTYNSPLTYLKQAIESVQAQIYPHWELCIADDASPDLRVREYLRQVAAKDPRIVLSFREENGHISESSNTALKTTKGEWVALLDHDDLLHPLALYFVIEALQRTPDAEIIFSDEDKIDANGLRYGPYFKGDYNRELMWAQNMISHLGCYKRETLLEIDGFRKGFEGSQDYDLALRVIERSHASQIVHVPRVLYHWRAIEGSTALASDQKPYAELASRKALTEHLSRIGIKATVSAAPEIPNMNRVQPELPSPLPLVSILIPTRDRIELLRTCIDSLQTISTYPQIEIIVIDNGSIEEQSLSYFATLQQRGIKVIRDDSAFNYSALNNRAAKIASGEFLCLMNNDIEITTPGWLEEMLSFAALPGVGAVGTRLWYPQGHGLQHGGVVIGLGGVAGHAHVGLPKGQTGYFGRIALHHRLVAVTAACLLIRKSHYSSVMGLDENLAVAFNDVDFCLRLYQLGLACVFTPYAEMVHHESASRGNDLSEAQIERFMTEEKFMHERWKDVLKHDPFFSPNLSLQHTDFRTAEFSRVKPT